MKLAGGSEADGEGVRIVPVSLQASGGEPVIYWPWGRICFDFSTMQHKARIPLDYAHEWQDSDGYIDDISVADGVLLCGGAIVVTPGDVEIERLVTKMENGVPYEASMECTDGETEYVPEDVIVSINGREQVGPLYLVRNWTLGAVAICKFGVDSKTKSEISVAASRQNESLTSASATPPAHEGVSMSKDDQPANIAGTIAATAPASDTASAAVTKLAATVAEPAAPAEDLRASFKLFVEKFGPTRAAKYFADGLELVAATSEFASELAAENAELRTKLAAVDRGGAQPIGVPATQQRDGAEKTGLSAIFRKAGSSK